MNTDISSFESFICFCNVSWVSVQWSTLRGKNDGDTRGLVQASEQCHFSLFQALFVELQYC